MWYIQGCVGTAYLTIAHALLQKNSFQGSEPSHVVFHMVRFNGRAKCMLVHRDSKWMAFTHTHLLSKRNSPQSRPIELYYFHLSIYFPFPALNYWYMNPPFVVD